MSRSQRRKEHPLSMRLPEGDIAIIDRAATLRGRSRTDFVREAAVRAAEEVIMETLPLRMGPAAFEIFAAAISGRATPRARTPRSLCAPRTVGDHRFEEAS